MDRTICHGAKARIIRRSEACSRRRTVLVTMERCMTVGRHQTIPSFAGLPCNVVFTETGNSFPDSFEPDNMSVQ